MDPCIFHADVNSAFLSWSAVERLQKDPTALDLRKVPSAVGGDISKRHGIITAKSIPAKKYGIHTGEPVVKALKKCPDLILIPSSFQTYRKFSSAFIRILKQHCSVVEQASIDEAYLDMTGEIQRDLEQAARPESVRNMAQNGFPQETALSVEEKLWRACAWQEALSIKNEIRDTLGFTINVGIAKNRLLAKTASDFSKPDKIHTLYPEEIPAKLWTLPIGELHGCGHATAEKLEQIGIHTVGDAAHADRKLLQSLLGEKGGIYIWNSANGIGSSSVHVFHDEAKSISNELTTRFDITADNFEENAPPLVHRLSASVARRMQKAELYGTTVGISVKTNDFRRYSRQLKLPESTDRESDIETISLRLLRQLVFGNDGLFASGKGVRLIGVAVSGLDHGDFRQMNLFDYMETHQDEVKKAARKKKLEDMLQKIRGKYGEGSIHKGTDSR